MLTDLSSVLSFSHILLLWRVSIHLYRHLRFTSFESIHINDKLLIVLNTFIYNSTQLSFTDSFDYSLATLLGDIVSLKAQSTSHSSGNIGRTPGLEN